MCLIELISIHLVPRSSSQFIDSLLNNRFRIVEMDIKMGTITLAKPGATNEPPKTFSFDAIFDWKYDNVQRDSN